jgi:hypothetical protein
MADTVDTIVLANTNRYYAIHIQNRSDGTGESNVVKVDKSTLTGPISGVEPGSLVLLEARWSIQGFASVRLNWDHTTDDEIMTLTGNGYEDFRPVGGLQDPKSAGDTGDVLLTTNNNVSGNTYDITLLFRKKA